MTVSFMVVRNCQCKSTASGNPPNPNDDAGSVRMLPAASFRCQYFKAVYLRREIKRSFSGAPQRLTDKTLGWIRRLRVTPPCTSMDATNRARYNRAFTETESR